MNAIYCYSFSSLSLFIVFVIDSNLLKVFVRDFVTFLCRGNVFVGILVSLSNSVFMFFFCIFTAPCNLGLEFNQTSPIFKEATKTAMRLRNNFSFVL